MAVERAGEGEGSGPLLFAHRGGWFDRGHPHNSLDAFRTALDLGAEIESDVRLSADGVPMLVHDAVAWRGPLPVVIRWLPASWLRRLGIPSLEDLYRELGHDYELSIDLKDTRAVEATIDVARRFGAVDRLWLVDDDLAVLDHARSHDADVKLVHENRLADLRRRGVDPHDHLRTLASHRIDAVNTHWRHWTPALVADARGLGLRAFGSLVDKPEQLAPAHAVGLDGLYVDHIEAALAARTGERP